MVDSNKESFDDCILYELLVYSEWKQDPEILKYIKRNDSFAGRILQNCRKHESSCNIIDRILHHHLPWHLAVGEEGKVVAILQDTVLEIRTSRDEYSSVVGKASIAKDANPQWRKLSWSPNCSMIAVGHSNGVVSLYDLLGSNIFNIYPQRFQENQQCDKNKSLAFLGFVQSRRKSPKWSAELITVDYDGELNCYLVSPTDGYQKCHSFSFAKQYPHGITAVGYHPSHDMLFVSGPSCFGGFDKLKNRGISLGLTSWRLLSDFPFCKLALSKDEEQDMWNSQNSWWNWIPSITTKANQSTIFKLQVSPGGKFLACLHICGSISIWHVPGLRLYKYWHLQDQPDHNVESPLDKRHYDYSNDCVYQPVDINWWSDHAVIVARHSGAVSVCTVTNLQNLLGESPEFLAGSPQVSAICCDQGFLGLECETVFTIKKRPWDDHPTTGMENSDESEVDLDDDETSLLNKGISAVKTVMYVITDMERFQPKKKKPKFCQKTYRLLGLKSTTPYELYTRKIDSEEYGEALALAKAYNLDADFVYQQQWRNNKVSVVTIHDYLSKVTKRNWVVKECLERVPETFVAARELLQFGLDETSIEKVFSEGFGDAMQWESIEDEDVDQEEKIRKIEDCLLKVDVNDIRYEEQTLLLYRQELLKYFDRLCTYEIIMGGPHMADEFYDSKFYDNFRSVSPLESTVKFAREGNWKAVEIMFTYHGDIILSHWLPVLSSFPETVNPYKYRSLLPECDAQGNVFSWNQIKLREEDWCEKSNLMNPEKNGSNDTSYLSSLKQFECNEGKITADVLTSWFIERVHEIEGNSCMVDHALSLTKLAKERNVKSQCLEHLYDHLLTLDILVYDVHLEGVKLSDLQKMSQLDICKLLMSKTSATTFTEDLRRLLFPFLLRCEKSSPGSRSQLLHDYLIDLSSHDLSLPLKMMESIKTEVSNPLVPTVEESTSLALSCVYAYPHCDQLHIAFQILQCIPEKTYSNAVYEKVKELECDLEAARILERNKIHKPLAFIQENKKMADVAQQLFTRLARNLVKKVHSPTEKDWSQLLIDILDLQRKCFTCISVETCYEIYSISILASGSEKNIESAANILQCHEYDYKGKKVPYKESVKLVVQAALEYFDSAGSLADRTIDLAKACLNLIRDENEDIKELQDLITALQLLNDFGITMLPLQVRLCTERLRLVEKCIRSKPSAYRNTQKLLDLAHKLQACDKDKREREGRVLVLIAEAALQVFDYEFCAEICKQLLAKHHAIGWQVMQKLGQCEDFDDLNLRCELLGFALLFSPPDVIESLVNIRCSLEAHLLQQGISEHTKQDAVSDEEQFSDALTYPSPPSKESPVRRSNHTLQNANYSKPSARSENCLFSENSFPAFYCALEPTCHVSSFSSQYDRFSDPEITDPVLMMSQTILRVRQLKCSTSQEICGSNAEVLLQVAERCILEDMSLGLSHVLPVTDISVVDACLSQLAWASLALQLTAYCYALNGFKSMQDPAAVDKLNQQHLYYISPTKLIQHMIKLASENTTEWTKMLLKYKENMMDIHEGEKLQSLGCGIDLHRFALEKQYQEDSILGLAMTVDEDKFLLAITLASRHGVSVEEVVARHITSLLLNSEANWNSVLTRRWQNPHLLELVKLNPDLICNRLFQYAYPSIDGADHQRILSFFTIIETVAEDNVYCSLSPKEHIKLIKKVKAASSDIDYKRFVEPSNNILQVVTPALQRNNIDMIAKLLKTLPLSLKCTVHPGGLYSAWAQKEFFKVGVSREQTTSENWLEQYELCAAHFNKMKATDVLSFVDGTCFSKQAVELVPMESRITILNRVKGFCQLQTASSSEDKDDGWSEIIQTLVQRLNHLKTVSSLDTQDYHQYRHLLRLFDLSKGDSTQLDRIVEVAVMSSMSIESLRAFVAKVAGSLKSFEQCLASILKNAVENTRNDPEASELLVNILQRMKENLKYGCTFVPPEVETLCTNPHLSPEIKLKAVELLQSSKPDEMLLYHHIQAIVASGWTHSGISFQEADLETEEKQLKVFVNMLEAADTWQQLLLLKDLLERWPQIAESCSSEAENPWLQLTYKMLTFKGEDIEDMGSLLEDIFQKAKFSGKSIQYLVLIGEESVDVTYLLLLCLLSDEASLHATAESLIRKHMHVDSTVLSDKLISLMLHKGLAPRLVTTPAYPRMIEHLVTKYSYDKSLWDSIINQLIDSEKFAEAGAISLLQMEIPCSLYVFSSSLSCMDTSLPDE